MIDVTSERLVPEKLRRASNEDGVSHGAAVPGRPKVNVGDQRFTDRAAEESCPVSPRAMPRGKTGRGRQVGRPATAGGGGAFSAVARWRRSPQRQG